MIFNNLFYITKLNLPHSMQKFNLYKLTKKDNPDFRIAFFC